MKKKGLEEEAREYWKLSEYDERVQDQSHWLGSARWDRGRWLAYGDFHGDLVLRFLREHAPADYTGRLGEKATLDWGCGGGANLRAFCSIFGSATGVDVSDATVSQCAKQLRLLGCENFTTLCFPADRPGTVLERLGPASFDFVFSAAVFQHFPSRDYALRVLEVMEKLMRPDACGLIQVRYDDGSDKLRQKESDYAKNVIYMTSFKAGQFADQLKKAGLTMLASVRDLDNSEDRHEYFFFRKVGWRGISSYPEKILDIPAAWVNSSNISNSFSTSSISRAIDLDRADHTRLFPQRNTNGIAFSKGHRP